MKKLLLFITLAAAFVMAAFFLLRQALTATQPVGEPYAVQQAREAAQVADLQRDAANADFWSGFLHWAAIVILLLAVCIILAAMLLLFAVVVHRLRIEEIRVRHDTRLIMPTPEGNYPGVLTEDETGPAVIRVKPGNKPYPRPADNVIIGNSPYAKVANGRDNVPIIWNPGGLAKREATPSRPEYTIREVQSEQLGAPEPERALNAGGTDANVQEFGAGLARCKAAGEGKQASIEAVTGVKKGGSKAWKAYSEYWDAI